MLVVHPSDELYGADRVLLEVVATRPDGMRMVVWLPDDLEYPHRALTRQLRQVGVTVVRRSLPILRRELLGPFGAAKLAARTLRAAGALARRRPDLVYLSTSATLLLAWPARLLGARVVLHVHEAWQGSEGRGLGLLARAANEVICVSEAVRDLLPPHLRARALVIHNGIPVPRIVGATAARPADRRVTTFVLASRWNSWKGHEALLNAWGRVLTDDVRLLVLGGPPPSGASVDVKQLIEALPNASTVELVGETDQPGRWIAAADCVLVPSTRPDPLPTIAIEAAALGKATLASAIGGLPEIVVDGVTGRLLPPDDPEAWARAIITLDRVTARRMGQAARLRFEREFQPARFREDVAELLWGSNA